MLCLVLLNVFYCILVYVVLLTVLYALFCTVFCNPDCRVHIYVMCLVFLTKFGRNSFYAVQGSEMHLCMPLWEGKSTVLSVVNYSPGSVGMQKRH